MVVDLHEFNQIVDVHYAGKNASSDSTQAADGATFGEKQNDGNCNVTRVCLVKLSRLLVVQDFCSALEFFNFEKRLE